MKAPLVIIVAALMAAAGLAGWLAGRKAPPTSEETRGRKLLYYQSAMHPWIKSDEPGNCTICGMKLTPVYEGDTEMTGSESIISLSTNIINVMHVATSWAERRPIKRTLQVAGQIDDNPTTHRVLSAYVAGRIEKLHYNYTGAEVQAGEPLALIYSPNLLAAEREYLILRQTQPDGAAARFGQEQERLIDAARTRLRRLGLQDDQIDRLEQKGEAEAVTEIRAPISGTVVMQGAAQGQYVQEGTPLFELADFSVMWFLFDVYERDLPWVRPGQRVEVRSPALGSQSWEGTVAFVDPNIKEMSRSARVRVELPNPILESDGQRRRALLHKLYAEGQLELVTEPVLTVPRSAVLQPGDEARVYVVKAPGAYERRKVEVGRTGEEAIEIISGLEEGEEVVTTGNLLIDAQAQIHSGGHAHAPQLESGPTAPAVPAMDPAHAAPVIEFLQRVAAANAALAADDLAGYGAALAELRAAAPALEKLGPPVAEILTAIPGPTAPDLNAARLAYLPFSAATVDLASSLAGSARPASLKVFKCPMYPAPGKTAYWIQTNLPIRNPFYGAEMLDCGSEVK